MLLGVTEPSRLNAATACLNVSSAEAGIDGASKALTSRRRRRYRGRRRSAGAAVLDQSRKLLLGVAVVGLGHAGGHDQRHRLLDGDVELDHLVARRVEEEPGGRVR